MNKDLIATVGPSSFDEISIRKMDSYGVKYFRINLSHTDVNDFENISMKKDFVGLN